MNVQLEVHNLIHARRTADPLPYVTAFCTGLGMGLCVLLAALVALL